MTYAPETLKAAQTYLKSKTGLPWAGLGIVGDAAHDGGYHCGDDRVDADDYSVDESARDARGLTNAASALDIGNWSGLRKFSVWLVGECERGAADTLDIREVIYSPDGKTVKRWDRLRKRTSGDSSHKVHTHISYFRDSEKRDKTALFKRYFEGGAAPVAEGAPAPTLRENDTGPAVAQLQRALNDALGLTLVDDGDFGPKTTTGVKALQRHAGLTEDGIYGRDSAAALTTLLEDDMALTDKLPVTTYAKNTWGITSLNVEKALAEGYVYDRNASDKATEIHKQQAVQTALLQQILAAQSDLTEAQIAAAVEAGVRQAMPSPEELAAAVAEAVDHELDVAAAAEALREVLRTGVGE